MLRRRNRFVLDVDTTDVALHGGQEGHFFHGYYDHYCYLPLYVFCGEHLLCVRLRQANIDASAGSLTEIRRIVGQIRERWPEVRIILRGDSGFCRDELMSWCEANQVITFSVLRAMNGFAPRSLTLWPKQAGSGNRCSIRPVSWSSSRIRPQLDHGAVRAA